MNIHTPERQVEESMEQYKQRRIDSKTAARLQTNPPKELGSRDYFLIPHLKDTKHTRNNSTKRKGAL